MNLYREQMLDHYHNPRNFGKLSGTTISSTSENVSCGDSITIFLEISSSDKVTGISFEGEGCAVSIASTSLLTEYALNKSVQELLDVTIDDLIKIIGVEITPSRIKCASLGLFSLQKALKGAKNS